MKLDKIGVLWRKIKFLAIAHNLRKIILHGADALKKIIEKRDHCI